MARFTKSWPPWPNQVLTCHVLRDLTRGGLAAALCDIAEAAAVGIAYDEDRLPVPAEVHAACSFMGLDPIHVANEAKLVAIVDAAHAGRVLDAMRSTPGGAEAVAIGLVTAENPATVVARTRLGATRVIARPLGEELPRIC